MVKTGCGQDVLPIRKEVRAILEDVGGGVDRPLEECHIVVTELLLTVF